MVQNSLIIPSKTLEKNQLYILQLNVTFGDKTGSASIDYNTNFDSKYSFDVVPTSGIAFSTDFIISAVSQEIDSYITNFVFGYIKGGEEYYLTRDSQKPLHLVKLPQGEISNQLTLFLLVSHNEEIFRFEKVVTVTAPTMTSTEFIEEINSTLSDSVDESSQFKIKYEYFKNSIGSVKLDALNLILDGFQADGSNVQSNQDEETKKTLSQALKLVGSELSSVSNSALAARAFGIFEQLTITDNTQIANNITIEFSKKTFENLFSFADSALSSLSLFSDQTTTKSKLFEGVEYALRGSMSSLAPGNKAYILSGSNISVLAGKISAKGHNGSALITSTSRRSRRMLSASQIKLTVPGSSLPENHYLQVSVIMARSLPYTVTPFNSDGTLKSAMFRVNIEENDVTIATIDKQVYSKTLELTNLTDPILIEVPFTGSIGDINTLSCGFTTTNANTINYTGITTTIGDSTVTCATNHLTDFIIEEHVDPFKNQTYPTIPKHVVNTMDVYKCFAFWMTLLLLLTLPLWINILRKKDLRSEPRFSSDELEYKKIHIYSTLF